MATPFFFIAALLAAGVLYFLARTAGRSYLKFRGKGVVTCPETGRPAAVEVDAGWAAVSGLFGTSKLRLSRCSRWPERRGCGQQCLAQIEDAPQDCLLRTLLVRWYRGKSCVLCGKPFQEIHWHDRKPGLMKPNRETAMWSEFRPEQIPEILSTYLPVCWNCHIAETFRRKYPELVVDRTGISKGQGRNGSTRK
ncbi:MAG: hypothetical protein ACE5JX_19320 [Acidobacteriota bacterium]